MIHFHPLIMLQSWCMSKVWHFVFQGHLNVTWFSLRLYMTTWIQGLFCLQRERTWADYKLLQNQPLVTLINREKNIGKYKAKIGKTNIGWKRKSKTLYTSASHWFVTFRKRIKCKRFSKCRSSRITWSHIKHKILTFSWVIHDHMYSNIFPILHKHVRKKKTKNETVNINV